MQNPVVTESDLLVSQRHHCLHTLNRCGMSAFVNSLCATSLTFRTHVNAPCVNELITQTWTHMFILNHWGRVRHIYVNMLTITGSDNGLSPIRHQAIIWTTAEILLIRTLGKNFSENLSDIHTFSFKTMHLKMSSPKWRQFVSVSVCSCTLGLLLLWLLTPQIAKFMDPTWGHLGPIGPRWDPCWPQELAIRDSYVLDHCEETAKYIFVFYYFSTLK